MPHFYCYLGSSSLAWTHAIADTLIGVAYVAISATLAYLIYRRRSELPFHGFVFAFAVFIVACGSSHLMEAITVWIPVYVLSAAIKVVTALASIATAVMLHSWFLTFCCCFKRQERPKHEGRSWRSL
jgi:hypothetical protein